MPKVDPESGEPMSDAPEGAEDTAGGESADPSDGQGPSEPSGGSPS